MPLQKLENPRRYPIHVLSIFRIFLRDFSVTLQDLSAGKIIALHKQTQGDRHELRHNAN